MQVVSIVMEVKMSIKKRKTRSLMNFILFTSTIVVLNVIGVSYAYYTDSLQIITSVTTGNLDVSFDGGSKKDLDLGVITIVKDNITSSTSTTDSAINVDSASTAGSAITADSNTVNNTISSTNLSSDYEVVNKSSIPIKPSIASSRTNNDVIASFIYENQEIKKVKLDLVEYLTKNPGEYDFDVQIIFDQFNRNN